MKKFEYKLVSMWDGTFEETFKKYGEEGWEVFATNLNNGLGDAFMKREIPVEYEYKESRSFESMLKEGWEPIGICLTKMSTTYYLFRRPKP